MKTYYELLGIARDAPADEIKQAFRRAIAKYHPDKVQHLGEEFQQLAQERASELTIAYKTLVDRERRAEYDATLGQGLGLRAEGLGPDRAEGSGGSGLRAQGSGPDAAEGSGGSRPKARHAGPDGAQGFGGSGPKAEQPPRNEAPADDDLRQGRDVLLKRAALARADQLLRQALPGSEPATAAGFELGYYSKPPRLFGPTRPWVLARFVPALDAAVVHDVWTNACRGSNMRRVPVCVFLLAARLPPERELATLLGGNGRGSRNQQNVTLVPVDVRDWRTWVPRDADEGVRSLAKSLRAKG